jgi:3-methyladenine DNA glycosylase/8-oxoguanine DNA glycosylase
MGLDGAIAECRKAIELDPKLAGAYRNLGSALYTKGTANALQDLYNAGVRNIG